MVAMEDKKDKLIIGARKSYGKGNVISARLPPELIKEVDKIALKTGRTRSEIIFMCVEFSLPKIETE
jgi:predicted DNA-binding protein